MSHWAESLIGMPWIAGQSDCWSFARQVWTRRMGWDVPAVPVDATDPRATRHALSAPPEAAGWQAVATPIEGDAVLMGRSARPGHVGVWITPDPDQPGVLHSVETSGVIFTERARLAGLGWRILGFYRWAA